MFDVRKNYSAENCSVERTLALIGERWTLLVLREAFFGLRRFDELHKTLGCARNVLATRLAKLVDHGILQREPYRDPGQRVRDEYRLTEKGLDLVTILLALMQWGDRWESEPDGAPLLVRHRGCGKRVRAQLACSAHAGLVARDLTAQPGPGARRVA